MTRARTPVATVQVVHQGTEGASVRLPAFFLQVVTAFLAPRVRVAALFAQIIRQGGTGALMRVAELIAQLIRRGDVGSRIRDTETAAQVIWRTGVQDAVRQRAWAFDFDGHSFYVLDLAERGSLVYDATTDQWSRFDTPGMGGHWNMKNGFHWRDGNMVVAGDAQTAELWRMTPDSFLDDGWRPVVYEVRGAIFVSDIEYHRQYALRLQGSTGRLADDEAPVLYMQFSDDQGQSWSAEKSVELVMNTRQRIEFRSLGAFTAPGRIFRLYDQGGLKFIAYAVSEHD